MSALLIEEHPVIRLGLFQMLENIHGSGDVTTLAPADIPLVSGRHRHAALLVFGMPTDSAVGWQQLDEANTLLAPQHILLLADALPQQFQQLSTAHSARYHICGSLPKSASLEAIEAAIRMANWAAQDRLAAVGTTVGAAAARSALPLMSRHEVGIQARAASVAASCPAGPHAAYARPVTVGRNVVAMAAAGVPAAEQALAYHEAKRLKITPRQYEVLVLLAHGYPIKTISHVLHVSEATVKTHACTLYRRLKVRNKGEAVYTALQRGATLEWVPQRDANSMAKVAAQETARVER